MVEHMERSLRSTWTIVVVSSDVKLARLLLHAVRV